MSWIQMAKSLDHDLTYQNLERANPRPIPVMETTDHDWESFAKEDPYWAVLTQERFRNQNLNEKVW